ncbi:citrate lyase acyl carrier protein [Ammoniphilus sp. YIM 78166]|uniref:citrate lyase acyl carrier protein n=1 Tax=Ammoniphilus sp. YIM 78166 TaxID=1644106 RepID=UPI0010702C19|nr:citrate lyase acyl carrier protein [Ammoniphilus sp. YIM 78166]
MSRLQTTAQSGTLESSDIMILLAPGEAGTGIRVELISPVLQQYGEHIKRLIAQTIESHGIKDAIVHANDKGALDFTITARVKAAIMRAS